MAYIRAMVELLERPWLAPLTILLASVLALGAAFTGQYSYDLEPCVLCLYQRWPYAICIGLGLLGLALAAAGRPAAWVLALAGAVLIVNAGIAGFHVGVEQAWWQGSAACSSPVGQATTLAEMRALVLAAPVVRCDEIAWSLFGVSMAGYNLAASLGLGLFSLAMAGRAKRRGALR